jgi:hypothetical protein
MSSPRDGLLAEIERLSEQCAALQAECDSFYAATAENERANLRLLRAGAAALERAQVGDADEAEAILCQVVTLNAEYVPAPSGTAAAAASSPRQREDVGADAPSVNDRARKRYQADEAEDAIRRVLLDMGLGPGVDVIARRVRREVLESYL